jgi:hypothetical protein
MVTISAKIKVSTPFLCKNFLLEKVAKTFTKDRDGHKLSGFVTQTRQVRSICGNPLQEMLKNQDCGSGSFRSEPDPVRWGPIQDPDPRAQTSTERF